MRTFRRLSLSVLYFLRNFKKVQFLFGTVTVLGGILLRCALTVWSLLGSYILFQEFKVEGDFDRIVL